MLALQNQPREYLEEVVNLLCELSLVAGRSKKLNLTPLPSLVAPTLRIPLGPSSTGILYGP